jgi:hypothetical protein
VISACLLPWTARNYRAFGEVVLVNTNAGFAFFWGNHPIHGTDFIPILPNDRDLNYGTLIPRELSALNEAQLDRALFLRGLEFVRDEPLRYVRLSVSRAKEYFKFWPTPDSGPMSNIARVLSFGIFVPFLLGGVALTFAGDRRSQDVRQMSGPGLLLLVASLYSLVHLLTWALIRYRLPVDAMTMPFAAAALVAVLQRLNSLKRMARPSFLFAPR